MIQKKTTLIAVLIFPIVVLLALTTYRKFHQTHGHEIKLPITAYDPRDLLSGHYLRYNVDYGLADLCKDSAQERHRYICLKPSVYYVDVHPNCDVFIQGTCQFGRFLAGIEQFFIPEEKAASLEAKLRNKSASILLSISDDGQAYVKNLLIDDHPWNE